MLQENKALKLELEDVRKELAEANKKIKEFARTQKKEKEVVLERMREIEQNYQKYATYYSKFMDMKNQCDEKDEQLEELGFNNKRLNSKVNELVNFIINLCKELGKWKTNLDFSKVEETQHSALSLVKPLDELPKEQLYQIELLLQQLNESSRSSQVGLGAVKPRKHQRGSSSKTQLRYQSVTRRSMDGEDHNDEEEELPESTTSAFEQQKPSSPIQPNLNIYEYTL